MAQADLAAELQAVAVRFAPRWSTRVVVDRRAALALELIHPLSFGLEWRFNKSAIEDVDLPPVEAWLQDTPEIQAINDAPLAVPHVELLRGLRSTAKAFDWDNTVCRHLGQLLHVSGCISADEAAWFRGYTGRGAPMIRAVE